MKKDLGYVKGPKGDTGPQGAVGPQGAKGEKGDPARVCGKLAGADGNIQLVAADVGGLSAEQINALLLNKANGSWRFYGGIQELGLTPGNETMTEITAAMPNRSTLVYYVGAVSNVSEYPSKYGVVEVVRHSDYRITLTFTASLSVFPKYWVGSATIDGFTGWVPQATATPPEEHALLLAEGWTAGRKTKFSVSQESLVLVTFGVWGPANMSDRAVIAQLPPGFRPGELISTGCMVTDESTYTRYPAGLDVNRAGEVIVFSKQPGWTIAVGQVAFYVST